MSGKRARPEGGASHGNNWKSDNKRRYFQQSTAAHKAHELAAGMRGVLVSCDVHMEREAIKECFRLFESMVEDGDEAAAPASAPASSATAGNALAREIEELKRQQAGGGGGGGGGGAANKKSFSVAQTGCGGNVLIRFERDAHDPLQLVQRVMERALASHGSPDAPHVIRMLPVQATCSAKPTAIESTLKPLVGAALRGSEGTYAVQWRRRCNSDVEKMAVIDVAAGAVLEVAPKATVALREPDTGILTEVIKAVCCVSVLPNWSRYHGYNLRQCTEAAAGVASSAAVQDKADAVATSKPAAADGDASASSNGAAAGSDKPTRGKAAKSGKASKGK